MGSILNEYNRLVSIGKSPGKPLANEQSDRQGGKFQRFVNNNYIYWNSRVDPARKGRLVAPYTTSGATTTGKTAYSATR